MQKFFSLIAAALMVAAGMVAFTSSPAAAACDRYEGCFRTNVRIATPDRVERCDRTRVKVRVTSPSNRNPRGQVLLVVRRDKGNFRYTDVQAYRGERIKFRTPKLCKRGGYTVKAKYSAKPGSRWNDSKHFDAFRVTRR